MIEAALIGAGGRGMFGYGSYALRYPNEIRFIAVAEPDAIKRDKFAELHGIPAENRFSSWEELLNRPQLCEALLICTPDALHYRPTMRALQIGYHILLEKPMSPDPLETIQMAEEAERLRRTLTICHTMRYTPFFRELKDRIDSGAIGRLVSVQWTENVGYWHQAHSFVRGNWRNADLSSSMILQKCCHDMDMLQWLIGGECQMVSSFGSLTYFKEENAPEGSTERCTDGCKVEQDCLYSALKWYYNDQDKWLQNAVTIEQKLEARLKALQEGPYGRCVYRCDNNVVDHQVVNLLFDNEVTVAFTMSAFTEENTRTFKIMGTKGELRGHHLKNEMEVSYFSGRKEVIRPMRVSGGHSGGDTLIMRDFIRQIQDRNWIGITSAVESARSHMIAFAAEQSRITGKTIRVNDFISEVKNR